MIIWFASGNIHKKKELRDILSMEMLSSSDNLTEWELKIPSEAGLKFAPEEKGNSFVENALIKAEALHRLIEGAAYVIADDSGLCVDALGGRPGIHSARYGGSTGAQGEFSGAKLGAAEKNALLLSELGDNPQRKARFICAMVLYCGADRFFIAQESLEGELVKTAKGEGGFGYDPILFIPHLGRTVAELSEEEKNLISHRGKAARAIAKILNGIITPPK